MVSATAGALLTCDVPTKEFLVWLNNQHKGQKQAFIIRVLDDTHLLVKEDVVDSHLTRAMDGGGGGGAALALLQEFQAVQAARAEAYSRFAGGFRDFLGHGQEGRYKQLMAAVTPAFAAASQQVIHIEGCLRSDAVGRPDLAALLRRVQELERDKLRLTLSWQALRAAHAAGRFSWQAPADRPGAKFSQEQQAAQLQGLLQVLRLEQEALGRAGDDVRACTSDQQRGGAAQQPREQQQPRGDHHHHGCCGHGHAPPDPLDAGGAEEPSEAEYSAAVREALQALDGCVEGINEALEELRDAAAELAGADTASSVRAANAGMASPASGAGGTYVPPQLSQLPPDEHRQPLLGPDEERSSGEPHHQPAGAPQPAAAPPPQPAARAPSQPPPSVHDQLHIEAALAAWGSLATGHPVAGLSAGLALPNVAAAWAAQRGLMTALLVSSTLELLLFAPFFVTTSLFLGAEVAAILGLCASGLHVCQRRAADVLELGGQIKAAAACGAAAFVLDGMSAALCLVVAWGASDCDDGDEACERDVYAPQELLGGTHPQSFMVGSMEATRIDYELTSTRGEAIQCSHYLPLGAVPREGCKPPVVVYCHCNSGSRRDAEEAVWHLLPCGVGVVAFDFTGSGLSDGRWVTLGAHEVDDLAVVVAHLRAKWGVGTIGLWGRSMGAVTALLYAHTDPGIAGMVLDSPFSRLTDLMLEIVVSQRLPIPKVMLRLALKLMRASVRRKAGADINSVSPLDVVGRATVPAMFGHGEEDSFIDVSHSVKLHAAYAAAAPAGVYKNLVRFAGDHNHPRPAFFYSSVCCFFHQQLRLDDLLLGGNPADTQQLLRHGSLNLAGEAAEQVDRANGFINTPWSLDGMHQLSALEDQRDAAAAALLLEAADAEAAAACRADGAVVGSAPAGVAFEELVAQRQLQLAAAGAAAHGRGAFDGGAGAAPAGLALRARRLADDAFELGSRGDLLSAAARAAPPAADAGAPQGLSGAPGPGPRSPGGSASSGAGGARSASPSLLAAGADRLLGLLKRKGGGLGAAPEAAAPGAAPDAGPAAAATRRCRAAGAGQAAEWQLPPRPGSPGPGGAWAGHAGAASDDDELSAVDDQLAAAIAASLLDQQHLGAGGAQPQQQQQQQQQLLLPPLGAAPRREPFTHDEEVEMIQRAIQLSLAEAALAERGGGGGGALLESQASEPPAPAALLGGGGGGDPPPPAQQGGDGEVQQEPGLHIMANRRAVALSCLLACLLLGAARADDPKPPPATRQIDPAVGAAAGAAGAAAGTAVGALTGGLISPDVAASVVANKVIAADSAAKAAADVGGLVGGLFAGHGAKLAALTGSHKALGAALVEVVRTVNSLNIAGGTAAVGVADAALTGIMSHIRSEALALGNVYAQLLGEFGRAVGAGVSAAETLGAGGLRFLNPFALGVDKLEVHLNALISFLEGAADASVSKPGRAAHLAPFLGTLKAVQGLLDGLQATLLGPDGGLLTAFDDAIGAAAGLLNGAIGGAVDAVAGKPVASALAGLASTSHACRAYKRLFTSSDPRLVMDPLVVPESFAVASAAVADVSVAHGAVGALQVTLLHQAPGAERPTAVVLKRSAVGGAAANLAATGWDDAAASEFPATPDAAPFTGNFRPASPLSGFNGQDAAGSWVLRIADVSLGGEPAGPITLTGWSLILCPGSTPVPVADVAAAAGPDDAPAAPADPAAPGEAWQAPPALPNGTMPSVNVSLNASGLNVSIGNGTTLRLGLGANVSSFSGPGEGGKLGNALLALLFPFKPQWAPDASSYKAGPVVSAAGAARDAAEGHLADALDFATKASALVRDAVNKKISDYTNTVNAASGATQRLLTSGGADLGKHAASLFAHAGSLRGALAGLPAAAAGAARADLQDKASHLQSVSSLLTGFASSLVGDLGSSLGLVGSAVAAKARRGARGGAGARRGAAPAGAGLAGRAPRAARPEPRRAARPLSAPPPLCAPHGHRQAKALTGAYTTTEGLVKAHADAVAAAPGTGPAIDFTAAATKAKLQALTAALGKISAALSALPTPSEAIGAKASAVGALLGATHVGQAVADPQGALTSLVGKFSQLKGLAANLLG
ncbi:yqkD [Scenedesmus sp. PABB004]|nr:yqkD [Scenedesmus sp. PABB004]